MYLGFDSSMGSYTLSKDGEGGSPPSANSTNNDIQATADDNVMGPSKESTHGPAAESVKRARIDKDAKLVDIAFLIDGTDRLPDVLDVFREQLHITDEAVREKHPDVTIHVAFISYRSFHQPLVADLKPLGNGTFNELLATRRRYSSSEYAEQDVLHGLELVPGLGWSADYRLLVQVSDAPARSRGRQKAGNKADDGSLRASRAALLQRLRKDCKLQAYYFAHFKDGTRKVIEEIQHDCEGPGWLTSEQLDEPDALPYKIAKLIMALLDNVPVIPPAAASGEVLVTDGVINPVTPERTPELIAEPIGAVVSRSPSQTSEHAHRHKVILPSEVDGGQQSTHRYRSSSNSDTSPPRSKPDVRPDSPEDGNSLKKGNVTPKGSLRSEHSSGQGTPRSRLLPEVCPGGGAVKGSPLSGTGTAQATPLTAPRPEAPYVHGDHQNGPPSGTGTGQATPQTDPRSKAGSLDDGPKSSPSSENGGGKATSQSSTAGPGQLLPKVDVPAEVSMGAASSVAPPIPDIWSATTSLPGPPVSQQTSAGYAWGSATVPLLPWSERALEDFKGEMKRTSFVLLDPADQPLTARLDGVFSMPQELWPVLPPGALYCLEASDPRVSFQYLQHRDFPTTKVRLGTYFGKWGRHLVDYVVSWQPTPRAEAAWQLADGKQPPLPWEPRQVVAHTTQGEYQYANTRMRFKGPKSTKPDAEMVEWSDAHGVDLLDTKAANETAARNSDKDRDAHLIDPPRPNTWGELARRPLIGSLRNRGGGAYMHHINYDNSGLRTTCGRRVPAGYFFTLVPNVPGKTPAVPGGPGKVRPSSAGRAIAAARQSRFYLPNTASAASAAAAAASAVASAISVLHSYRGASPQGPSAEQSAAGKSGGLAAQGSSLPGARPQRPSSAGARRASRQGSEGSAAAGSGLQRRGSGTGRSLLGGMAPATPSLTKVGWSGGLQANASSASCAATVVGLDVVSLMPTNRWRTYDVPFNHPLNAARAQDLGAEAAKASGRNVRSFSDAAAVMKVAEQELRLPRAFVPGPLVVPTWDDIPRLYAEHMEAARALMPVTELDNYGSSKLHMLIHHLQCAATLEYDRLDAKLLLLPQMSRLGRKSAEIDAWLQALVEHASYLYDKLEISDSVLWAPAFSGEQSAALLRSSVAALPPQATLNAAAAAAATAPGQSQGWVFPDPLRGTVHESRSAVNVTAQMRQSLQAQQVPAARVTQAEWSTLTAVMDPTRHAALYEAWARLRPVMTGAAAPGGYNVGSSAGSMAGFSSDAGATATGFGENKTTASGLAGAAAPDPFGHGTVNREVLDYLPEDLAVMSSPDFVPPPPPPTKLPKHRGYRGEGPLPAELVADMPAVFKPVRCRGTDETPLPATYNSMDIWNMTNKAELASPRMVGRGIVPHPRDVGATRSSQVVVHRLQAAREFASSQQAAIRKSMQLAKGGKNFDESDVPYYGSDVAEDEFSSDITSEHGSKAGTPRGRLPAGSRPGGSGNGSYEPRRRPGTATQTSDDLGKPTAEESALLEERSKAATEAAEVRRSLLRGRSGKTREQMLDEALRSADAAIRSLHTRPPPSSGFRTPPPDLPDSPRLTLVQVEPREAGMQPYTRGPPRIEHSSPEVLPFDWYLRPGGGAAGAGGAGAKPGSDWEQTSSLASPTGEKGPEPFSLEKIWREPAGSSDVDFGVQAVPIAKLPVANFSEPNMSGYGGVVDYETAMSRRRAIAGAEVVHLEGNFISKSDLLNLLVVYCNLDRQPDQVELLQRTIEAPVSLRAVSAAAKAATAVAIAAGPASAAAAVAASAGKPGSARQEELETEGTRQRIRSAAWLLGVTWRRISNETYTSFMCRVMGWPAEVADALHRTRATHIIARALVHGHDMKSVPKAPPRH